MAQMVNQAPLVQMGHQELRGFQEEKAPLEAMALKDPLAERGLPVVTELRDQQGNLDARETQVQPGHMISHET